jgi:hypothetical protein
MGPANTGTTNSQRASVRNAFKMSRLRGMEVHYIDHVYGGKPSPALIV